MRRGQKMMRLNKFLAKCGVASRRACDTLITNGRVSVNGEVVTKLGRAIDEQKDEVQLNGKLVKPTSQYVYILLNKPVGYLSAVHDERGRRTVLDLVKTDERVFPVGRLDLDAEGALLLTNDGGLTHRLLLPKFEIEKRYRVTLDRGISEEELHKIATGVVLEDAVTAPCQARVWPGSKDRREVEIVLHEGRKRQVKRMFAALGFRVQHLQRVEFSGLTLKGLGTGQWRHLTPQEVGDLNRQIEMELEGRALEKNHSSPKAKFPAKRPLVIAIDGPAGSGKSTTAKGVTEKLGYLYLDTGAMYRAVTLKVLNAGVELDDEKNVAALARESRIQLINEDSRVKVLLDGQDVSEEIRSPRVTNSIGPVARNPEVRRIMVSKQQALGKNGGIVAEGRDIGTVVFPKADLKIFLVASLKERVQRRQRDFAAKGIECDFAELAEDIRRRDEQDCARTYGPLKKARDAIELDTTCLTIEEQVNFVFQKAKERMGRARQKRVVTGA